MKGIRILIQIKYLVFTTLFMVSCATEFEKARTSNDPTLILKKAHEYFTKADYTNAQSLYELAIQYYRGKREAEDLFYNYAYTFYHLADYSSANHYFKSFASTFYSSAKKEDASFMAAYSLYKMSPNFKLDQSNSLKAIDAMQEFMNNYPESKKVKECNDLMDEMRLKLEKKAFNQGKLYYDIGQYQAATISFHNLLKDFPGSGDEEEAKYLLIKSSYILAENSVIEKKQERYEDTAKLASKYIDKMKDKVYRKEIQQILTNTNKIIKNKS